MSLSSKLNLVSKETMYKTSASENDLLKESNRERTCGRQNNTKMSLCLILGLLVLNKKASKTVNSAPYGKANAFVQKTKKVTIMHLLHTHYPITIA